ncbi:MAG: hypothetical protein KC613_14685, partial [Myxococcales bacterium]|nr:hypothetical protein [Myxococcales bacterium]
VLRAFLAQLPPGWEDAVVDASLAWLSPGLALDPDDPLEDGRRPVRAAPVFRHEPFPGVTWGVRGASNRWRAVAHRICVVGDATPPALAEGWIDLPDVAAAESFWWPTTLGARDAQIRGWIDGGRLRVRPLTAGHVFACGWGTFICPRPTAQAGFQLWLRATLGDPRPRVNGLRNLVAL